MNIQEFIDDHYHFHSAYQMDHFITFRNGLTLYGCYKQALREWYGRYSNMVTMYVEREKAQINLDEAADKLRGNALSEFDRRRLILDTARLRASLDESDKSIADAEREFVHFLSQAVALKEHIGPLTPERRAALERELWMTKIKASAAIDLLSCGGLKQSTVELLHSVPLSDRAELADAILKRENYERLVDWFMGIEPPTLVAAISIDVRSLCCESARLPSRLAGSSLTDA